MYSDIFYVISIMGIYLALIRYLRMILPKSIAIKNGTMTSDIGIIYGGMIIIPLFISTTYVLAMNFENFSMNSFAFSQIYTFDAIIFIAWNKISKKLVNHCYSIQLKKRVKTVTSIIKYVSLSFLIFAVLIGVVTLFNITINEPLNFINEFVPDNKLLVLSIISFTIALMTYILMFANVLIAIYGSDFAKIVFEEVNSKKNYYGKILYHDSDYVYVLKYNLNNNSSSKVYCLNKDRVISIEYSESLKKMITKM